MAQLALHHVSVIVTDLPRVLAFYQKLFGLEMIERILFTLHWLQDPALRPTGSGRPQQRGKRGTPSQELFSFIDLAKSAIVPSKISAIGPAG